MPCARPWSYVVCWFCARSCCLAVVFVRRRRATGRSSSHRSFWVVVGLRCLAEPPRRRRVEPTLVVVYSPRLPGAFGTGWRPTLESACDSCARASRFQPPGPSYHGVAAVVREGDVHAGWGVCAAALRRWRGLRWVSGVGWGPPVLACVGGWRVRCLHRTAVGRAVSASVGTVLRGWWCRSWLSRPGPLALAPC